MKRNRWMLCSLFAIIIFILPQFALPVLARVTVGEVGFAMEYYTVEFDTMGGSSVDSLKDVPHGSKINEPESPTKKGMVFEGWFRSQTKSDEWIFSVDIVESDLTLYARWRDPNKPPVSSSEKEEVLDTSKADSSRQPPVPSRSNRITESAISPVSAPSSPQVSSRSGAIVPHVNVPTRGGTEPDETATPPVVTQKNEPADENSASNGETENPEIDTDTVDANASPLSSLMTTSQWSVGNLLMAIGNIVLSFWVILLVALKYKKSRIVLNLLSIFAGVANVLAFLSMEHFTGKMVFVDLWSPVMLASITAQVILIAVALHGNRKDNRLREQDFEDR